MKKFLAVLILAAYLLCMTTLSAFSASSTNKPTAYDDDNYGNFGSDFTPEYAIDGMMETGWQKAHGTIDSQGYISKECYLAFSWSSKKDITSINVWWRSSTRAEASKSGYVLQVGEESGGNIVWKDASCTYSYGSSSQDNGRFVCDTITFNGNLSTKHLRFLIKRGIDYRDQDRMFSPKINEVEFGIAEKWEPVEIPKPPVINTSSTVTSSEEIPSTMPSSEVSPEETSSVESNQMPISSLETVTSVSSETSQIDLPTQSVSSSLPADDEMDGNNNTVWIVICIISASVIIASAVALLINSKKK